MLKPTLSGSIAGGILGLLSLDVHKRGYLIAKAVELALSGDASALRICIDRLIPAAKAKDDPVTLPALNGSLADNAKVVVTALGTGELSPEEAATILSALATQARIVEVDEMEKRITALEKGTNGKP